MRGAAFLSKGLDISGIENSLVVDIGGTTTDVGQLVKGFPREAASRVEVNFNNDFSCLYWCISLMIYADPVIRVRFTLLSFLTLLFAIFHHSTSPTPTRQK